LTALSCPSATALTVISPSLRPASSTATNVYERLCTSAPTTTMVVASLHLISDWTVGPAGGHISVGAVPRSYQVTPAGSLTPSAGTTHARQPEDDTEAMSQTPGDRDPTTATRAATLTLTLTSRLTTTYGSRRPSLGRKASR